jgi:DNA repair exonuclease SbcCD ATPase subunit
MDINKLEELESQVKAHKNIKTKLEKLETNLNKIPKLRSLVEKSINHEKTLRMFPSQAIGSVALHNKLNENYSFFDEAQFNKIIRFVQHIEEKEKRYRDLYVNCTNDYINNPEGIPIKDLKKEQHELKISYQLLTVLANEINGDVVSFNKVYNKLEDAGIFMTVPEKQNQEYLMQISSKLDNLMNGLKAVFDSLQETNRNLREISQNTSETAYNTGEMSSHLWDISYEMSNK